MTGMIVTTPEWVPPADLPFGVYTWSVQGYNPQGRGPWSDVLEFAVGEPVPEDPMGSLGQAPTVVSWDNRGCGGATWYHVWIGGTGYTLANFWAPAADTRPEGPDGLVADIPAASLPLPAGNHRWQMRAWSPSGMGPWSEAAEFSSP